MIREAVTELWPGLVGQAIHRGRRVESVVVDLLEAAERVIVDVEMCDRCKRARVELVTGDVVCGCGVDRRGT